MGRRSDQIQSGFALYVKNRGSPHPSGWPTARATVQPHTRCGESRRRPACVFCKFRLWLAIPKPAPAAPAFRHPTISPWPARSSMKIAPAIRLAHRTRHGPVSRQMRRIPVSANVGVSQIQILLVGCNWSSSGKNNPPHPSAWPTERATSQPHAPCRKSQRRPVWASRKSRLGSASRMQLANCSSSGKNNWRMTQSVRHVRKISTSASVGVPQIPIGG